MRLELMFITLLAIPSSVCHHQVGEYHYDGVTDCLPQKQYDECWSLYTGVNLTWHQARDFCTKAGGYLPYSNQGNDEKRSYMMNGYKQHANLSFWYGLSDTKDKGVLRFKDGTVQRVQDMDPHKLPRFTADEPDPKEHTCVALVNEHFWRRQDCNLEMNYAMCEKAQPKVSSPNAGTQEGSNKNCDTNNGGCSHKCEMDRSGVTAVCSCREGYVLFKMYYCAEVAERSFRNSEEPGKWPWMLVATGAMFLGLLALWIKRHLIKKYNQEKARRLAEKKKKEEENVRDDNVLNGEEAGPVVRLADTGEEAGPVVRLADTGDSTGTTAI